MEVKYEKPDFDNMSHKEIGEYVLEHHDKVRHPSVLDDFMRSNIEMFKPFYLKAMAEEIHRCLITGESF